MEHKFSLTFVFVLVKASTYITLLLLALSYWSKAGIHIHFEEVDFCECHSMKIMILLTFSVDYFHHMSVLIRDISHQRPISLMLLKPYHCD